MGAASHGYCIVGFHVEGEDLYDVTEKGLICPLCGPKQGGKFCSDCGAETRVDNQCIYNDRARQLASHLGLRRLSDADEGCWHEDFDEHCNTDGGAITLGVKLSTSAYDKEGLDKAFEKAQKMAAILFPDKEVDVLLEWGHELSW